MQGIGRHITERLTQGHIRKGRGNTRNGKKSNKPLIRFQSYFLYTIRQGNSTYLHIIPVLGIKGIETEQGADLYRYGALGKKGQLVLRVLTESKKATSAEILEKTGLNRRAIERILKRSTWAGIVIKNGRGLYSINPNVDLSEAARRLGVDGKGEKQRRQHNAERDAYKGHLAKKKRK